MKRFCLVSALSLSTLLPISNCFAEVITVTNATAEPGETFSVNINLDDSGATAGAAFTVTFDPAVLTLVSEPVNQGDPLPVTSSFFDTFTSTVTVDNVDYDQALAYNPTSGSVALAGARATEGSAAATLFTLTFEVAPNATQGCTINIIQTELNNPSAGYDPNDGISDLVPMLVGIEGTSPNILYPVVPQGSITIYSGTYTLEPSFADIDLDQMDDNWEENYFGDITSKDGTQDSDGDGYTDLQEYLNYAAGETDPFGLEYDPTTKNSKDGTGYNVLTDVRIISHNADFNGDNINDILWRNPSDGWVRASIMNGASETGVWFHIPLGYEFVTLADFDGNGTDDILWRNTSDAGSVHVSIMSGTSETGYEFAEEVPSVYSLIDVADFNNDNKADLLWRDHRGFVRISIMDGGVETPTWFSIPTSYEYLSLADFNNDGNSDILWRDPATGFVRISLMNGATETPSWFAIPASYSFVTLDNFDSDQNDDIMWRDPSNGYIRISLMSGATETPYWFYVPLSYDLVKFTDFNGDGVMDMFWRDDNNGFNRVSIMNAGRETPNWFYTPLSYDLVTFADFNGDGNSDILWRNYSSGFNRVSIMSGPVEIPDWFYVRTADEFVAIADFDGDGSDDILWRNFSDGWNRVSIMNSSAETPGWFYTPTTDEILVFSDFNSGNNTDILWRNKSNGFAHISLMSGSSETPGWFFIPTTYSFVD